VSMKPARGQTSPPNPSHKGKGTREERAVVELPLSLPEGTGESGTRTRPEKIVEIFTDGACMGNPGPGGWGALLRYDGHEREISGGEAHTTNNRMELMAAIAALEALKRPVAARLHTDSQYLREGITRWIINWKRKGWRTA